MNPKHDTKFHVPVDHSDAEACESPGVSVCELHHESFKEAFGAMKSYMSKTQTIWTITTLSAVAIFYGVTLWATVSARCSEADTKIQAIKDESATKVAAIQSQASVQQVKLEYIEQTVKDMNNKLDDLRKEIARLNRNP